MISFDLKIWQLLLIMAATGYYTIAMVNKITVLPGEATPVQELIDHTESLEEIVGTLVEIRKSDDATLKILKLLGDRPIYQDTNTKLDAILDTVLGMPLPVEPKDYTAEFNYLKINIRDLQAMLSDLPDSHRIQIGIRREGDRKFRLYLINGGDVQWDF